MKNKNNIQVIKGFVYDKFYGYKVIATNTNFVLMYNGKRFLQIRTTLDGCTIKPLSCFVEGEADVSSKEEAHSFKTGGQHG